jgi:hypothetical protein
LWVKYVSITNNIPQAEGLTAIEAFIIVCIVFVFGALIGEPLLYRIPSCC